MFQQSAGVPPGMLISDYRRGESPLLQTNIGPALDSQEDEAAQEGIGHQKGAYPEIYDKTLEERVLASLVWHTTEAQASYLTRLLGLQAFRRRSF